MSVRLVSTMVEHSHEHVAEGLALARDVIARVEPGTLVNRAWPEQLNRCDAWAVVAFGKAAMSMASAAFHRLGERAIGGVVVGPAG